MSCADGRDGSVALQQDVDLWVTRLAGSATRSCDVRAGRSAWVHVARGSVVVNGQLLAGGDAAAISGETITLTNGEGAEVLVFDVA